VKRADDLKSEVLDLAAAACEQHLAEEDAARLEELVSNNEDLRQLYKLYIEVHAAAERYLPRLVDESEITEKDGHLENEWGRLALQKMISNRSTRQRMPWFATSLAVLLLVGGAWFFAAHNGWFVGDRKPLVIATLTKTAGCSWTEGGAKAIGSRLTLDETISLGAGLVEIEFGNGATVVLEGPATLTLTGDDECYLLDGKLVAKVPKRAIGFAIRIPNAKVVDLGTRFGLHVPEIGVTEVHVFEGDVELTYFDTRTDDQEAIVLHEKEAAQVDTVAFAATVSIADRNGFKFIVKDAADNVPARIQEEDGVVAFEAESFTHSSVVDSSQYVWRIDTASRNQFAEATSRHFVQLTSDDGTQMQFDEFKGEWLEYDFEITSPGTYRLWLLGAATGYGPDGRPGEIVELTELRYRSDAFTGSRAIEPIKTNFNKLIGVWQVGDGVPAGEATVPPFEVGSRHSKQIIPPGARKIFLALHDNFQWTNNVGQVSARLVWQQEKNAVPIRVDDVVVDAKGCIWFAWATDEQLGNPLDGKGPYQESTNQRPLEIEVPKYATTVSISASGIWSHLEKMETFPGAVQIKLHAIKEIGTPIESEHDLVKSQKIALSTGENFQWTPADGQGYALNAGIHRLRLYAATPAVALDKIVMQRASGADPIGPGPPLSILK
jgi:hypothetical protein